MDIIDKAIEAITEAEAIIVAAGSGMGVDSGLPDYRGTGGYWNNYPVYRNTGIDYEKSTRPSGFVKDPELAWGFYGHRLDLYRNTVPHKGFEVLKTISNSMPFGYFVFTSNVDGQFQKAGFSPGHIHECHGSIHQLQCIHPCCRETWSADGSQVQVAPTTMRAISPLPRCQFCGSMARPNIFAFGDTSFVHEPYTRQAEAFRAWRTSIQSRRVVLIECGAGTAVPGIRRFGEEICRQLDSATLIRINPTDSQSSLPNSVCIENRALLTLLGIATRMCLSGFSPYTGLYTHH